MSNNKKTKLRQSIRQRLNESTSESTVDFGYRNMIVRTPKTSNRIQIRLAVVALTFIGAAALLAIVAIGIGATRSTRGRSPRRSSAPKTPASTAS